MLVLLLGFLGGIFGAAVAEEEGFFFGAALGVMVALWLRVRSRVGEVETDQRALEGDLSALKFELSTLRQSLDQVRREQQQARSVHSAASTATTAPIATTPQPSVPVIVPAVVAAAFAMPDPQGAEPEAATPEAAAPASAPRDPTATTDEALATEDDPGADAAPQLATPEPRAPEPTAPQAQPQAAAAPVPQWPERGPDPLVAAFNALRGWLLGGNTVVRAGTLVLLVGVVLLLKYAADHAVLPIEARLSAAALIAVALSAFGYRQRHTRPGFGLTLQGGGVAAVYLVVFFAYRTYELVPSGFAFAAFAVVAAASASLAVAQHSLALAFIGTLGGFAAPILASSGSGNHVALFSYYLLLNVMVVSVAWFRAWRPLNLLAFVCTYGVATAWGALKYRPEHFDSTEPFVIAFFLLFVAVTVLFALRSPPRLGGVVDGSLVFGTPLVTLLAQSRIVDGKPMGMALSAAALGVFYAVLGTVLWKRARDTFQNLVESFIAIAVAFGTLAIPFALDDALTTSMAWALEGAGIYWNGTRQGRRLPKFAGIALQALAAVALFRRIDSVFDLKHGQSLPLINPAFVSCLTLTLAAFVIAISAHRAARRAAPEQERVGLGFTQLIALWGYSFWVLGWVQEIDLRVPDKHQLAAALLVSVITAWSCFVLARTLDWATGRLLALLLLPEAFLILMLAAIDEDVFDGVLGPAWPVAWISLFLLIERSRSVFVSSQRLFAPTWWLVAMVASVGCVEQVSEIDDIGPAWVGSVGGAASALALVVLATLTRRAVGPFRQALHTHLVAGGGLLTAGLLLYCLNSSLTLDGDSSPLPYAPLVNPVDLTHALCLLTVAFWYRQCARLEAFSPDTQTERDRLLAIILAGVSFVWLNAIVARSVCQYADVSFRLQPLWRSVELQSALSITWTLVALFTMLWATRRGVRVVWIVAAALLGVVVFKLFTVDLARLSTLLKIGTFLVVGVLLMAIGYFSPVPPEQETSGASE